jgi:hypothetical protein
MAITLAHTYAQVTYPVSGLTYESDEAWESGGAGGGAGIVRLPHVS